MNEIVTTRQMLGLEAAALARGIREEALVEAAGAGLAEILIQSYPAGATLVVFAGKGHNGADALVAARQLARTGKWRLEIRLVFPPGEMKPLAQRKLHELGAVRMVPLEAPSYGGAIILLDGILGLGATGPLLGPVQQACAMLNHWRAEHFPDVVAVDLPSGLGSEGAVQADHTVTFGYPKSILVGDAAAALVGRLSLVPLPELGTVCPGDFVITPRWVKQALPRKRAFSTHKGQAGRIGIVAGSLGCVGAARLCAAAAVRAGAGLVTLYVPEELQPIAAAATIPEVMVRTVADLASAQADAWGVGPGLGSVIVPVIMDWLRTLNGPAVVDADALNWLARRGPGEWNIGIGPRILTPHPGEMGRLLAALHPELLAAPRAAQATGLAHALGVTLLLKGSRSVVAEGGHPLAYNSTGTPTMASGGMGDVLTGITAAFMGQGMDAFGAACSASWVLGRAGELAVPRGIGASLVIDCIHEAVRSAHLA